MTLNHAAVTVCGLRRLTIWRACPSAAAARALVARLQSAARAAIVRRANGMAWGLLRLAARHGASQRVSAAAPVWHITPCSGIR
ncbi:hypothetical protein Rsub_01473 [Raphidocelis subcapitata]|uniref:Uncharacterized protein n=1 Tax=Raphidocelis subcapitata TaxID=307507 RepID=A0A2V0NN60_9CHLO|nr:hypothetical protein Rsub_01473 [Raphidocelis subcapitata]|eukprot:GBF88974.1 hypothetical protein Rsub_01473 [Raphidocelis subcapitata]